MKDLREETIKSILHDQNFTMSYFGDRDRLNAGCGTACCIAGHIISTAVRLGVDTEDRFSVSCRARDIWTAQYGQAEADRLEFDEKGWGWKLDWVTPEAAIAHLNGAPAVQHGQPFFEFGERARRDHTQDYNEDGSRRIG